MIITISKTEPIDVVKRFVVFPKKISSSDNTKEIYAFLQYVWAVCDREWISSVNRYPSHHLTKEEALVALEKYKDRYGY